MRQDNTQRIKWTASLCDVREVTLLGSAELGFWHDRLREQDLRPAERNGKAQIMIVGADARFKGIRFRELSVCVLVEPNTASTHKDAAFLLGAWNSVRFFAYCERVFFRTPYHFANVLVHPSQPPSLALLQDGKTVFEAQMSLDSSMHDRDASHELNDDWEGAVYLPHAGRGTIRAENFFFAKIDGNTRRCAFVTPGDVLELTPPTADSPMQALVESGFVAEQWAIRPNATHAKSKTYKRSQLAALI